MNTITSSVIIRNILVILLPAFLVIKISDKNTFRHNILLIIYFLILFLIRRFVNNQPVGEIIYRVNITNVPCLFFLIWNINSSQSSPATADLSPAFHTRSPSLAPSIPPSGPDFTPSQPPSSMPSPIGSAEWNTDDDRMSTGHSVHTGSRSETETRVQKPSDRVKEEKETPKIFS